MKSNPKAIRQSSAGSCTRISNNFLPDVKKPPLLFAALNNSESILYALSGTKMETPVSASGAAPLLECPEDISTYTDINSCSAFIAGGLNPGFDEAEVVTLTWEMEGAVSDASPAQGINLIDDYTFEEGATIITYTATGIDGTTTTCTFSVTISDNQVPRLESMPADITVETAPGACSAAVYWMEPTATDNCTAPHLLVKEATHYPGDEFPEGTTTVYYTAYDAMGNPSQTESFTITVEDAEPPVLSLPADVTLACDDPLPAPWTTMQQLLDAGGFAADNCTLNPASFRLLSETPSSTVCPYTLTRVYQIADAAGNVTTAEHRIVVEGEGETVQPEQEEEVQLKSGMADLTATQSGNWSDPNTWGGSVPTSIDNVTIPNGITVTVDADAFCNDILIETGGTLAHGGAYTLQVNGNWTNNGTYNGGTNGIVEFAGTNNATISGTTSFEELVISKGSMSTLLNIADDVTVSSGGSLLMNGGLVTISAGNSLSLDFSNALTVAETAGFDVTGGTLTTGDFTITNEGLIRVSSGTANFGTDSGNSVNNQFDAAFIVSGGTVNIAGRLHNSASGTLDPTGLAIPSGIHISGGTVTLSTAGQALSNVGSLNVTSTGTFNFSDGTIVFQTPSNAATELDLGLIDGGTKNTEGGTFQFGNASTPANATFNISSQIPLHTVTTANNADLVLDNDLVISGQLNLNGNSELILNDHTIQVPVNGTGTYNFPLADGSGNAIPVTIQFTSGSFASGAYVEIFTSDTKHPENANATNYLNRHWIISTSGITNPVYNVNADYHSNDISGTISGFIVGDYSGSAWNETGNATIGSNTISITGITQENFEFTALSEPTVTVTAAPDIICYGASTTLTATATGDPIQSYSWSPATGLSATNIANPVATLNSTTTYTVTVTDGNGFTAQDQITITVYDEFSPGEIASTGQTICYNENPGIIGNTTSASGGDGNIEYQWQSSPNGSTWTDISGSNSETYDPSNLTTTTHYRRLAKDGTCNPFEASTGVWMVTVRPEFDPGAIETAGETICFGGTPSQIGNATPGSGGDGGIIYEWRSSADGYSSAIIGATSATYTPPAGLTSTTSYRRYANDGVCNVTPTPSAGTWTVTVFPELVAGSVTAAQTICYNTAPETLVATAASGGSGSFTYQWQSSPDGSSWSNVSGQTALVFTPPALTSTTHYRIVAAESGSPSCGTVESNAVQVTVTPLLEATASATSVACYNGSATVTLSPTGGTPPYTYIFNGIADADGVVGNVVAGTYNWIVTDAHNCGPVTGTIVISEPTPISNLSASITSPITCNGGTATVTISASGGTGTLSYTFNGQTNTTGIFTGVYAGTDLSYSVTDENGCGPVFGSIDVTEPPAILNVTADVSSAILCNGETATVTISATGGTAPLSYTFNGVTNPTGVFTGITPGTNIPWSVTDANNCGPVTGTLTVTQPNALTASVSETASISCFGGTAEIRITASGGTGIKTYSFDGQPENTTGIFTGITVGTYNWRVEDENGCYVEGTHEVQQPTQVEITSIGSNSDICQGETLTLNSEAQGGTGNRTFSWTGPNGFTSNSPNPSIANATPAASGTYTLRVTDANGCFVEETTTVTVHPTPVVTATPSIQSVCAGDATAAITFSGAPSYTWTNNNTSIGLAASGSGDIPSFTATNDNNTPVTATITVTPEGNGCTGSPIAVTITVNPIPEVTFTNNSTVLCDNGTTSIVLSSNVAGTTFSWSGDDGSSGSGNLIEETISTTVTYTVTPTANGCTGDSKSTMVTVLSDNYNLYTTVTGSTSSSILCSGDQVFLEFAGANPSSDEPSRFWGSVTRWETRFTWSIDNPNVTFNLVEEDMVLSSGISSNDGDDGRLALDIINNTDEDQQVTITLTPWAWTDEGYCIFFSCGYDNDWTQSCSGASFSKTITIRPFAIECPSDYVLTTNPGDCDATLTPDAPVINCDPGTNLTWSMDNGGLYDSGSGNINNYDFPIGTTKVTYRAQQSPSNYRECSFDVTVTDDEPPTINCPVSPVTLTALSGECGVYYDFSFIEAIDNCAVDQFIQTEGPASGSLFPIGTTTLAFYAEDESGNSTECSFDVIVLDEIPPAITCNDVTVCTDSGLDYTNVGTGWDATVSDNCSGYSVEYYLGGLGGTLIGNTLNGLTLSTSTGAPYLVTVRVTDASGNESTCYFEITINETPAVSIAEGNQAVCLTTGSATFTAIATGTPAPTYQWYKDGVVIAGATGDELILSNVAETDAGSYTVEVSNSCGAAVSAPAVLTVSTQPVITAQPASQTDCLGESVEFSVAVSGGVAPYSYAWQMRPTSGDAWVSTGTDNSVLTVADIGDAANPNGAEYRVTVTDDCGNSETSAIATLTVNELTHSLVSETVCQGGNTSFSVTTSGSSPAAFEWFLNGSPISNGGPYSGATSQTLTITNAQVSENGTYSVNVTFNITQPNNNGAGVTTCQMSADVGELLVDEGPDIVATPPNQTICPGSAITEIVLSNANGTPNTTYTWTRDNTTVLTGIPASGSGETISGTLSSLTPGTPQTTTFTITATANGCVSTGTATVTVVDNEAPVVNTCPSVISVGADAGICGAVVTYTLPTFDDNCDGAGLAGTLVAGLASGETFPVGTTAVTYEYTDAAGNGPATCSFDVIVSDDVNPVAVCQDISVQLDASGNATITAADVDNGSTDNCSTPSLSIDKTDFDCTNVGANTVTLTVTDDSGNTATCEATVTVEDNVDPTAVCQDITIQVDATGNVSISAGDIDNGSTDNCGIASLSLDKTDFDCDDVGANTVTLTVTDNNGNTSTCNATVTVEDNIAPAASCQDITVQLDATGQATITANDIDNGSSDNCGIASLDISQTDFNCSHAGNNAVTLTVTDDNGNVSTCDVTVTIEDTEDPVAVCQNITVQLDASGNATIAPADVDNGSSDNCGTPTLSLDKTSFDCTELGLNIVTLTVTDGFGNTATCNATVTVADDDFPVAIDASIAYTPIDCYGETTTVTITLESGGVGTLTYWLDGNSNATGIFENVPAGTYNWGVTNPLGCGDYSSTVEVTQPDELTATIGNTDVTCSSGNDGSITVSNPLGGAGGYEYSIDGGTNWQSNPTFTGLVPAIYHVMIRDANGCEVTLNAALEVYILTAVVDYTPVSCVGETDGSIEILNPAGGSGSYNYSIDGGTTWHASSSFSNLAPGTYDVQIQDAVDTYCVVVLNDNVVIDEPAILDADLSFTDITCFGGSDGTITASNPTGGFGTYEVSIDGVNWFAVSTVSPYTFTNLTPGSYTVQIRDEQYITCIQNLPDLTLGEPDILSAVVNPVDVTCSGFDDGTITITGAAGGSGTYEYSIDGGTTWQAGNTFENLEPGMYNVQIRDANATSCIIVLDPAVEITEPPVPTVDDPGPLDFCDVANTSPIPLTGTPSGVVFDITGGAAVGLADQTGVSEIPSFSTISGTATITITPRVGTCTGTPVDVVITVAPLPTVTAPIGLTYCEGILSDPFALNGTPANVRYDISGGAAIGLNDVTDVDEIPAFTPIAGTATLTVTPKALNCVGTPVTFTVTVRESPTAIISGGETVCRGSTAPSVVFTNPHNAVIKVIYNINGAGNFTTNIPANSDVSVAVPTSAAGDFDYELVSAQYITTPECINPVTGIAQFTILEPATPTVSGPVELCAGSAGNVYTTEPGMTNYIWSISSGGTITAGGTGTDNTITITWDTHGTKNVNVRYTDTNGCAGSTPTTYPVTVNPLPVVTITGPASVCANTAPSVYTTQAGMTDYTWSVSAGGTVTAGGGSTDNTITILWQTDGIQTVSVNYTNTNGCEAAAPRTNNITVYPEPNITLSGDLVACEGSTGHVYTTEAGNTNYVWTISAGGAIVSGGTVNDNTATVKWNTAGPQTISVNYTSPDGCSAQSPYVENVTVNPKASPTIAGDNSICAGSGEVTYTTESGMDNYDWVVSAGGTITGGGGSTDDFVTVRWDTEGAHTVSVNYENSYGCPDINPAVRNITVTTASTPTIAGVSEVCQGVERTYTTQSGMTDYQWSVSAGTITAGGTTTDNSVTILWDTDGDQSVSVFYTDGTGCTSTTAIHPVTVNTNAQPVITGNFIVCSGSTERYETASGMTNYAWLVSAGGTISSGGSATDDFVEITWGAAGARTISVNYTTPENCTPASPTVQNITVNELPDVDCPEDLTVCLTATPFSLTEGTPAGGTFSGSGVTGDTFDPASAGLGTHTITYSYTDGNSCANTCTFTITVDPVPSVADQNITICSDELFEIDLDALVPGASFTWTASHISGATISGFLNCNSSCGSVISQTLVNSTYSNQGGSNGTVRYVVTADDNNCTGTFNINVTVRPVISPRNISWNSNFDQNTYEVCVGGSVLNDNDLDVIPAPANGSYNGLNPQWEYSVTPDGPWLPAPGEWSYQGNYQWTVASELMSQVGTYYFRFSLTDENGCVSSSDIVDVRIISTMVVDAGEPDYICSSPSPSAIQLTGASVGGVLAGGTPSARWSASTGSLSSTSFTTNPAGVSYTPPPNYVGEVTLTLTTNDPSGACEPLTDTRTIYVLPAGPFENCYSPATWPVNHSNSNGSLNIDCAIDLIGSNNGSGSAGTTEIEHCIGTGSVTFDWIFTAPENKLVWHTGDQKSGGRYNSTTIRVEKPSNLEEGDLIIVTLHFTSNPGTINRPSGFNVIETTTNTYDDDATVASFYKIATTADLGGANYFTFTANTVGSSTRYLSVRVTGYDETDPIGNVTEDTENGPPVVNDYRTISLNSINGGSNSLLVAALSVGGYLQYPLSPVGMNTVFYSDDQTAARVAIEEVSGATGDKSFRWPRYGSVNSGSYAASAHMFIINPAPPDTDAGYYLLNGTPTLLSSTNGATGSATIPVTAGDEIGFRVTTNNNTGGAGELIIFNINLPNDIPVLTGETEILVEDCQDDTYVPAFVEPTVTDDCGTPILQTDYPLTSEVTENDCERTQTRTWVVVDDCGAESDPFVQTITWTETSPITIACPDPVQLAACTDQADIQIAYDAWKAGFTFTGGCGNVTDNLAAFPPLTDMSCGGNLEFTFTVADECGQEFTCTSNFEVLTADDLAVICPADPVLPACSSLAEIEAAYNAWKDVFDYTGGCDGVTTNEDELLEFSELPDLTCGGQIMFTYRADYSATGCEYAVDCIATFTVEDAEPISITVSPDVSLSTCSTTEEIETAYTNWVAGFAATGGCGLTTNIADIPALPADINCGGQISFTFTADNGAGLCTEHAEGTSVFSVIEPPELVVTCPPDPNLPGCSDPGVIADAYNAWIGGFTATGGCDVVTNIDEIPPLGDLLCEGTLEFTFVATNGNEVCPGTASCTSTFTIGDAPELTVFCPAPEVVHGCTPEEIQTDFDNWLAGFTFSGGCNAVPTDLSIFTPPATCGGTLIIDYEVIDDCGNVETCSSSFTVEPLDLAVVVPDDAFEAACQAQGDIDIAFADWLAQFDYMGGCGVTTTDLTTFSPPDACGGTIIINYSASDICGQVENGSAIFTIDFPNNVAQEPSFDVPADMTIYTDADCNYDADPAITGEPTNLADNCGEENLTYDYEDEILPGSCEGSFIINRTWTVIDNCLTETSHVQVITVEDNIAPEFTFCPEAVSAYADDAECVATGVELGNPTVSDNCTPVDEIVVTNDAPAAFPVGTTTVTWTATDACGNTATCIQEVTILDNNQPPTITCPDAVVQTAGPNNCYLDNVAIDDPVYDDNCGVVTIIWTYTDPDGDVHSSPATGLNFVGGETFEVGITTVTYIAYDAAGNESDPCSFTVTILDDNPPVFTFGCPVTAIEVDAPFGSCEADVIVPGPEVSDPCGELVTLTHDSPYSTNTDNANGTYPIGTTTITWTATDASGNATICVQNIVVNDIENPTIDCIDVIFEDFITDGGCTLAPTTLPDPVINDCELAGLTYELTGATIYSGNTDPSGFNYAKDASFNVGITHVTYTVTDASGNTATCTFDVWIKNVLDPNFEVICPTGDDANITVPAQSASCEADVTVPAPQINNQCVEVFSITYQINSEPAVSVPAPVPAAGVTTLDPLSETFDVGVHTVTWIITDASGNEYPCVITIEVTDNNSELVCPPNITRVVDDGQDYASNVPTASPTVTGNCAEPLLIWELEPPAGFESEYDVSERSGTGIYPTNGTFWLGVTTITYSLTDAGGNVLINNDGDPITCSFTVTVTNLPVIECPEDMEWDASETCDYETDPGVPTLITGSHPLIWTYTIDWADGRPDTYFEFDEVAEGVNGPPEIGVLSFPVGTTTITWTATDQFGNTASCEQLITVIDNTPPTFVPPPDPFEDCVDMLHQAVYDPVSPNPVINHIDPNLDKFPSPDFHTFEAGNTALDLDMTNYADNCCAAGDTWSLRWQIDFVDVPDPLTAGNISNPPITGTGQPSDYIDPVTGNPADIYLWGDGVYFNQITHTITYWITDCHGNESQEIIRDITITPRPQIIKVTGP